MVAEAIGIGLCMFLWAARVYVAARYEIRYRVAGRLRRTWKRGTPDWITRVMPWVGFFSWVALFGLLVWWAHRYF